MESADKAQVRPEALAVDRDEFSGYITERIRNNTLINRYQRRGKKQVPRDGITVVATGPLTAGDLYEDIVRLTGGDDLHFFDAAPIVKAESIDMSKAFQGFKVWQRRR